MSKFTPGEWFVNKDLTIRVKEWGNCDQMGDYQGCIVADLKPALGCDENFTLENNATSRTHALPETLANAHLIAAAPCMAESLEGIIAALDKVCVACEEVCLPEDCNVNDAIELAEAALKKARGEA